MHRFLFALILCCSFLSAEPPHDTALTYGFSGGRLGDNLISYMHAKWVSYKYDIPLLYRPFPHAEHFHLEELEKANFYEEWKELYPETKVLTKEADLLEACQGPCLYILPYCPPRCVLHYERLDLPIADCITIDWDDSCFVSLIHDCFALKDPAPALQLPEEKVCIAIHYRHPDSTNPSYRESYALKCPSLDCVSEEVEMMCSLFPEEELHFHLFTDHKKPREVMKKLQKNCSRKEVSFSCRTRRLGTTRSMLEDFSQMTQFDYIIRPESSSFSLIPCFLKNFLIEIFPIAYVKEGEKIVITEIEVLDSRAVR